VAAGRLITQQTKKLAGKLIFVKADVSKASECQKLVAKAVAEFGGVDVLCNNVGIQQRFWAMLLGQFFYSAMFAYIYTRGRENKSWIEQGIKYAILIGCLTVVPTALSQYVVYIIPYQLAIKWMVAGGVQMLIAGLAVAWIYKDGV